MSLIVWVAIYPALTLLLFATGDLVADLPLALRTLIFTVILVPLMVYLLIPFWTKVLNRYLFKSLQEADEK